MVRGVAWHGVQSKSTQITIICDDVKIEILYKMYKSNRSRQSVMDLSIQFFSVRFAVWCAGLWFSVHMMSESVT